MYICGFLYIYIHMYIHVYIHIHTERQSTVCVQRLARGVAVPVKCREGRPCRGYGGSFRVSGAFEGSRLQDQSSLRAGSLSSLSLSLSPLSSLSSLPSLSSLSSLLSFFLSLSLSAGSERPRRVLEKLVRSSFEELRSHANYSWAVKGPTIENILTTSS